MALRYNMETVFFGLPGTLLSGDCQHRIGFTHLASSTLHKS